MKVEIISKVAFEMVFFLSQTAYSLIENEQGFSAAPALFLQAYILIGSHILMNSCLILVAFKF